ncbi:MAG: ATP-binding protein [Candidatus Viridilinea halotolerans]|uniref:ATP-binding protein n=1 Tax=Candidatus Viridilinea halotolerans TaxID=2491704 RepID=A0A426TRD3_9CHLR|nr:MAG: ATP-binding protein [Candidatus Viridilinea halotolerans]
MGVAVGVAFILTFIISFLRLPLYLVELLWSMWLSGRAQRDPAAAARLWRRQPLHFDEVIQLPLYGLAEHVALLAQRDRAACQAALADVGASLRQGWVVPQALQLIVQAELERCTTLERVAGFADAVAWLPAAGLPEAEEELLATLRTVSRQVADGLGAATYNAREHGLREQVAAVQEQLTLLNRAGGRLLAYAAALQSWEELLHDAAEAQAAQLRRSGVLPLYYSPGNVLEAGDPSFHGRSDLFRTLEDLLANSAMRITPLLLGQPRTGKTSALQQFPRRLGARIIPVFLDMERHANAEDAAGLLLSCERAIREAALASTLPLALPPLAEAAVRSDPYRSFEDWISAVETQLGAQRWLLLSLDEFSRLDDAVRHGRLDERIFNLIRSLIQHHPRIAMALCGTTTLAECHPRWREALKSVQKIAVSYLEPEDAKRVLSQPHPKFPPGVYSDDALEHALDLTGGQPYLLHALGYVLLSGYNAERRRLPLDSPPGIPFSPEALDAAIPKLLERSDNALSSIWEWLLNISPNPAAAQQLLHHMARGGAPSVIRDAALREELVALYLERDLLSAGEDGLRFRVPLLARWIARQRR